MFRNTQMTTAAGCVSGGGWVQRTSGQFYSFGVGTITSSWTQDKGRDCGFKKERNFKQT